MEGYGVVPTQPHVQQPNGTAAMQQALDPQQQAQQQQQQQAAAMASADPAQYYLANYRVGKTLGIGSFGKVKVAEHILTNHKVAIKILNKRKIKQLDMEEKVRREIKILRLFYHPHIIRLYEVIETASDIYVVMEYVKSGELFDHIVEKGRLQEDEARLFFQQIISGVEYCHRNMVVHRDLKPENLLLDSKMRIKIADFGLSNVMRDGHFLKTSCGSPNYAAPEVISGKLYAGPEVDVWSCGVILYALLCGSLPFDDENIPNLFKKIKGGIYNLPNHLSAGARDLIPRMLLVDPLKRITIPEIRQHGWFMVKLPRYLAVQADNITNINVDEELIREVCRLGFSREQLIQSLKRREQNKGTVTYFLLLDNRRQLPGAYFREEMSEINDAHMQHPTGIMSTGFNTRGLVLGEAPSTRVVVERRWRLGLPSRGHPSAIMQELLAMLKRHSIAWKKLAPYNLKCRAVVELQGLLANHKNAQEDMLMDAASPRAVSLADSGIMDTVDEDPREAGEDNATLQRLVKFEIQLYKVRDGEYMVDFQRLQGDIFVFMDLCGKLIIALRC